MDTRPPTAGGESRRHGTTGGAGIANAADGVTLGSVGEAQDLTLFLSNAAEWEGPKARSSASQLLEYWGISFALKLHTYLLRSTFFGIHTLGTLEDLNRLL